VKDPIGVLRQAGYEVRFEHWRPMDGQPGLGRYMRGVTKWTPAPRGGLTICKAMSADGVARVAKADCSVRDSFCYRLGRLISAGRVLSDLRKRGLLTG
jgi:hypothetical protein